MEDIWPKKGGELVLCPANIFFGGRRGVLPPETRVRPRYVIGLAALEGPSDYSILLSASSHFSKKYLRMKNKHSIN
jgi:hypothetical protein